METHNYVKRGKFKNSNCDYALVRGIIFSSIYEAESYCTAHKLDVNAEIESDNPLVLAKCKQIALATLPMLRALQEHFQIIWVSLQTDFRVKIKRRNEARDYHDFLVSLYEEEATESLGKSNGFYCGMILLRDYINTLENVLLL